ncbi:hypothetical protein H4R34_003296 [Dimargaris verticillata]|uniref:RRM domain-containing protein n=1 Tax=Dimargaris verticillata TaxID=2761393 RepID=A0A9W8B2F8_9FUNG|nr:hypothetical protein H4R34_003296 [Dimargaris verticillata]
MTTTAPPIAPKETLYIHHLNEKVKKDELRRSLYHLFSAYGRVLDVRAYRTHRLRGQAFVVFRDVTAATTALRQLNGFAIEYAKDKSYAVLELEGVQRPYPSTATRKLSDVGGEPAAKRLRVDHGNLGTADATADQVEDDDASPSDDDGKGKQPLAVADVHGQANDEAEAVLVPNRILFVKYLPPDSTEDQLALLFRQYAGFREVRLIPGQTGYAFVEYDAIETADTAKQVLNGFEIQPGYQLAVAFAKR